MTNSTERLGEIGDSLSGNVIGIMWQIDRSKTHNFYHHFYLDSEFATSAHLTQLHPRQFRYQIWSKSIPRIKPAHFIATAARAVFLERRVQCTLVWLNSRIARPSRDSASSTYRQQMITKPMSCTSLSHYKTRQLQAICNATRPRPVKQLADDYLPS